MSTGQPRRQRQVCLDAIRAAAVSTLNLTAATPGSPLTLPPVRAYALDAFGQAVCPAGSALSPRLGGECILCGNGSRAAPTAGAPEHCGCFPGFVAPLAGGVACGGALLPGGNASDARAAAQQLCVQLSAHGAAVAEGRLANRVVQRLYLRAFLRRAGWLLDEAESAAANATFWRDVDSDGRAPASPTRRHGIAPGCNRCREGRFTDIYTGRQVWHDVCGTVCRRTVRLCFVMGGLSGPHGPRPGVTPCMGPILRLTACNSACM
jgi:hypothetical protein